MILLYKVVKSPWVNIDTENRVIIDIIRYTGNDSGTGESDFGSDRSEESDPSNKISNDIVDPKKILDQAEAGANLILENAKKSADKMLLEAQKERERLAEETREAAQREGYEEGRRIGDEEAEAMKAEAQEIIIEAHKEREEIIRSIEPEMVEVIIKSVHKLLTDSYAIHRDAVVHIIRKGLSNAALGGNIVIRVSADDYEHVLEHKVSIFIMTGSEENVSFVKDMSLNAGDCIIETPYGNIDCGLDQQFEALKENLYLIYNENTYTDNTYNENVYNENDGY